MSILNELRNEKSWNNFFQYKIDHSLLTPGEEKYFRNYIEHKKYLPIANEIIDGTYHFSPPTKYLINKIDKSKKRVVYQYNEHETMILKLLSFLLYKYDNKFAPNCYSFRQNYGVKQAIFNITTTREIKYLACYKVDIENYFNSIPISLLLSKLENFISDDPSLFQFMKQLLIDKKVFFQGQIIEEEKGIMAGVPISAFLSNVFLNDIDHFYAEKNILYARYADDIILFCESEKLYDYVVTLENQILKLNLNLNQDKREIIAPNNKWTFLGFSYDNGVVDISDITKKKIKQKIKRFSKKIRRWMIAKKASPERALKTINRKFNKKFYFMENGKDLTWSRWFFPVINTTNGLREIDKYMQECLRYVVTGKHNKKNYGNIKYSYLKQCNYRPLVSEYYKDKKEIRQ